MKLFIVVNVDWFFLSHRLPIAIAAKKKGFDVTIVSEDTGKGDLIRSYGFNFIAAPFTRSGKNIFKEYTLFRFLKKLYSTYKPDIIHHVTLKPAIYGSLAARKVGINKVVNAISGMGYNFTENRKGVLQKVLLTLMKMGFSSPKLHFIFQNQDDIEVFKRSGMLKDESNIHLIKGSGVDLQEFAYASEPEERIIKVMLPARMLYDKGVVEFVEAANLLKNKYADKVVFQLTGDIDPHNPASISEIELRKILSAPYITWLGYQKDMAEQLRNCHIVILPSYREGLPKSLIEACAIGRPIITTEAPGCKECVIEGYNGYLVPVKDHEVLASKLVALLDSKELRLSMGMNSRALAEREFGIEKVVEETLSIYNKLSA